MEAVWGPVPSEPGRGTREILEACARREIGVLFLVGVDPLVDFPDYELAERALSNAPFKVVQSLALGEYATYADAVLPAAAFLEKEGHFTDWEGRGQRIAPARDPVGLARPDWQIFQELSEVMGADMGLTSIRAIHEEMGPLLAPRVTASASPSAAPRPGGSPEARLSAGPGAAEGDPPALEGQDDDRLLLFTYPLLVDDGKLSVDATELKAALHQEPFVEVHPEDAERLGLVEGATARLRTDRGEVDLPVRVSDGIARGAVFVPFNQEGLRANTLLSGSLRSPVSLEPAAVMQEAAAEGAG